MRRQFHAAQRREPPVDRTRQSAGRSGQFVLQRIPKDDVQFSLYRTPIAARTSSQSLFQRWFDILDCKIRNGANLQSLHCNWNLAQAKKTFHRQPASTGPVGPSPEIGL